jgi:hypothetical protein
MNVSMTHVVNSEAQKDPSRNIAARSTDGKPKWEKYGGIKHSRHSSMVVTASKSIHVDADGRFFPVTCSTPESTLPLDSLIQATISEANQQDQQHQQTLNIIRDSKSLVTKTPWLRRTRWEEMFSGQDMGVLNQLTHSPDPNDHNMQYVWISVNRVIRACFAGVLDCHTCGWELVLFWLGSVDRTKESTKPFRTHMKQDTMTRYVGYWQQYIMMCILAVTEDTNCIQFTTRQRLCLQQINSMVELDERMEKDVIDDKVMELSVLLIQHSDYATQRSCLIYFCGILGYNTLSKQWRAPEDYTNILAGIQWCARVIILESALPSQLRDNYTEDSVQNPVDSFRSQRD